MLQARPQIHHCGAIVRHRQLHHLVGIVDHRLGGLLLQLGPLGLQRPDPVAQRGAETDLRDRVHQAAQLLLDIGQAPARFGCVAGTLILRDQLPRLLPGRGEHVGRVHLGLDHREQPRVDGLARHVERAGARGRPAVLVHAAGVPPRVHGDDGAATGRAHQQATEQRAGCPLALHCLRDGIPVRAVDAEPGGLPELIADDAQLGRLAHQPLALGPLHVAPGARLRVLQPLTAVPQHAANVELVVEDAQAALRRAEDGADGPGATSRRRHALAVQLVRDRHRRPALGVALEDPAHALGLGLVDDHAAAFAGGLCAVAVAAAAGAHAALELTLQAAARLVGQVVEVELVHQPARDAHHLAAPGVRVVAVAGADDADAAVLQALDDLLLLAHVAEGAVQAFDDQHVEPAGQRVGQQGLAARAQRERRGPADGRVRPLGHDLPAFRGRAGTCSAQLVFNRRLPLQIGAEPGVEGDAHGKAGREVVGEVLHAERRGRR